MSGNSKHLKDQTMKFLSERTDLFERMQMTPLSGTLCDITSNYNGKQCNCVVNPTASFTFPTTSFTLIKEQTEERIVEGGSFLNRNVNAFLAVWLGSKDQNYAEDMNYRDNERTFSKENCDKAYVMFLRKAQVRSHLRRTLTNYTKLSLSEILNRIHELSLSYIYKGAARTLYFDFYHGDIILSKKKTVSTMEHGFKFVCSTGREGYPVSVVYTKDVLSSLADKKWLYLDENYHDLALLKDRHDINTILMEESEIGTGRITYKEMSVPEYILYHLNLKEENGEYWNDTEELEMFVKEAGKKGLLESNSGVISDNIDLQRNWLSIDEETGEVIETDMSVVGGSRLRREMITKLTEAYPDPFELAKVLQVGVRGREYKCAGMCEREYLKTRETGALSGTYGLTGRYGPYNLYEYDIEAYLDWRRTGRGAEVVRFRNNIGG